MKVEFLKDWQWHKQGDVADIFDATAKAWISDGIAKPAVSDESRSVKVEQATVTVERRKVHKS